MLLIKYYSWNLGSTPIKTHKGDEKWPLFVNKQVFWLSASIAQTSTTAALISPPAVTDSLKELYVNLIN